MTTERAALRITTASPADLTVVLGILDEVAERLATLGITQWPARFSDDATWRMPKIRNFIESGYTYLVHSGDTPVGTFSLTPHASPEWIPYWPSPPEEAGYLHRMAVANRAQHTGIGARMLDWAAAAVASWPRPWLRLDCSRHNKRLHAYYEAHGFERVATALVADADRPGYLRRSGALYQRACAPVPA